MAKKITVVVSQGQSANPAKRGLEEALVAALLIEPRVEVTIVGHLNDLAPDGTGMLALSGIQGDMIVCSWLFPRAAHWILDRNGIRGRMGQTLLDEEPNEDDETAELPDDAEADGEPADVEGNGNGHFPGRTEPPSRTIYHLDLRWRPDAEPFVEEIRRLAAEATVETVGLMGWIGGSPQPAQLDRYLHPTRDAEAETAPSDGNGNGQAATGSPDSPPMPGEVRRIDESPARRWYPVIDYTRCTNCMECIDFCLFGVYGVDSAEAILVEQPDNCRKGCPACSRVCPENAIIFPQHKSPAIAGSPVEDAGAFKIDLSKLFGASDALGTAVEERDRELLAAGREAVGATVGMPKRHDSLPQADKDDLDNLMDKLDELEL